MEPGSCVSISTTQVLPSRAVVRINQTTEPCVQRTEAFGTVEVQLGLEFRGNLLDGEEPLRKELDGEHDGLVVLAVTGSCSDFRYD